MKTSLTFSQILEKEKQKVVKVKPWYPYVTGKDIPHKSKKHYSRKNRRIEDA